MAFYKSKFTGQEIDARLTQGTYDDAVKAGFKGTKEEFYALLGQLQETTDAATISQPAESDKLATFNKNIVDAINELHTELQLKPDKQDVIDQEELETFKDEIAAEYTTKEELNDYALKSELPDTSEFVTTEALDTKADKTELENVVKYTDISDADDTPRKTIMLDNNDTLSAYNTTGTANNIAMISKWDVVNLGSTSLPINLNGSKERPTYNDDKELALVSDISDPYEINLTNLLSAEDSESISTVIGGIDNLNATVQDNRIIVGTISNGSVSVSIRILGNVTTLYYLLDSVVGLTLNEVKITNTSGTLSKSVTTHSVLTENMVINSLDSDETTLPLSAAQGKVLKDAVEENNEIVTNIAETTSINVFPGVTVGGYIDSRGRFIPAATEEEYAATGFIPVKPNTYYYISNRNVHGNGSTTNIRCLDESKANPTKVRIASTGEEYSNWYTPNAAGTGSTDNGQIKTSPTAAYLQMNLKFDYQGNPNYAKLMLQEVGDTYDPSFVPSPYQPYAEEYKVKKSALPDNIGGGGNTVGTISLNNTPMFLLVGASHGEGYGSVKDKAFISYLSAMLDWSVENYSRSGSDYIEHFNSLEIGQQISNVYPGDMAGGIALVVLGGNESNYYSNGVDGKYFRANIIRCCSALKALGYRPILASYYGDMGRPWSLVVREVAREYGYLYYDLNGYGSRFYSPLYRPWWFNAHYATRTNVIQWYSFMKLLADIERPQTALKIFRNRNPYTQIGELLFDNNIEKMRYWRELTLHHIPLKPGFEKYVDRLDLCVYTNTSGETVSIGAVEEVQSEYNIARKGGTISMDDTGLLQFTFPAVGKYLTNVKFHIESDDTLEVYIRKYIDPSLQISLSDASAAFGITTATPSIVVGDVYTDSNNPGVNFTVTQYTNGTLIATPSGSFTAPGNTTGTLTRTSGTGTATLAYNTLRTAPGATYFANAFNKLGKWEALNGSGGVYELKGLVNYLDYDRCDILVKKSGGGAFVLKHVSADYEATQLKDVKRYDTAKMLGYVEGDGTQILTKTTFENPQEDWGLAVGKGVVWDGKVNYMDGNGVQQTGNHIPTYFSNKKGVTKILRLDAGDVLTQELPTMQGASYEVQRYKLKLTARYYPTEALDINSLPADVRTSQTFDFARIDVRFVLTGTNSYYTRTYYAPLNWVEIEDELVFDAPITVPNEIQITAVDNRTEFMLCEIIKQ